MGMFGLVIAFAPAIGPSLSGWLVDQFHWKSVFYVVFPIAVLVIIGAFFLLRNVTEQSHPKLDVLSIILYTFGFGGLLYGFSVAGDTGWGSYQVIIPLIVGRITLVMFILLQMKL